MGRPIGELVESDNKENLLEDLATRHVGPLAIIDLEVKLKLSDEVSQVVEMSTQTTLVDSVGL